MANHNFAGRTDQDDVNIVNSNLLPDPVEDKISSLLLAKKIAYEEQFDADGNLKNASCNYKNSFRLGDNAILYFFDELIDTSFRNNPDSLTTLMYALKCKTDYEVVHRLINRESDINAKCSSGKTALNYAILYNHGSAIVSEILCKGALVDSDTLFAAVQRNDPETVKLLIDAGGDRFLNTDGIRAFMAVDCKGCGNGFCCYKQTIDMMVYYGIDLKQTDELSDNIIHIVSCDYLLSLAIKCGVSVNQENCLGCTPISLAIRDFNFKKVCSLLQLGADPNCLEMAIKVDSPYYVINHLVYYEANITLELMKHVLPFCDLLGFETHLRKSIVNVAPLVVLQNCLLFFNDVGSKLEELPDHSELTDSQREQFQISIYNFKKELCMMRKLFIKDDLTFYQFCMLKKIKKTKLVDISPIEFEYNYDEIQELLPVYADLIIMRIKDNQKERLKRILRKSLEKIFIQPFMFDKADSCVELNYDCLYYISKYLSYKDLYDLFLLSVNFDSDFPKEL